ncbi:MAG: hypothetical protein K2K32_11595 [Muribaculaceae bacterium]|nr:hypothetical protein [Muribaculaceae bacterium]
MKKLTLKTISILVIALAIFTATDAFATLKIYKVKGNVTVKSKSKKAVKAERRAEVLPTDILTIPAGGSIDILNSDNKRIYSSVSTGSMSVKNLMDKAEAHAANITGNINRKVMAAVAETGSQKRSGYDAMGMVIHETDAIAYPAIALPENVSYLSYLIDNVTDPDSDHQDYIQLETTSADANDGSFNFVILSSIHEPLYFNIIDRSNKDNIQLLLPKNPIAAPKTVTVASGFRFLPDEGENKFIAIASDKDFSAEDIEKLLQPGYEPDEDYYLSILTLNP